MRRGPGAAARRQGLPLGARGDAGREDPGDPGARGPRDPARPGVPQVAGMGGLALPLRPPDPFHRRPLGRRRGLLRDRRHRERPPSQRLGRLAEEARGAEEAGRLPEGAQGPARPGGYRGASRPAAGAAGARRRAGRRPHRPRRRPHRGDGVHDRAAHARRGLLFERVPGAARRPALAGPQAPAQVLSRPGGPATQGALRRSARRAITRRGPGARGLRARARRSRQRRRVLLPARPRDPARAEAAHAGARDLPARPGLDGRQGAARRGADARARRDDPPGPAGRRARRRRDRAALLRGSRQRGGQGVPRAPGRDGRRLRPPRRARRAGGPRARAVLSADRAQVAGADDGGGRPRLPGRQARFAGRQLRRRQHPHRQRRPVRASPPGAGRRAHRPRAAAPGGPGQGRGGRLRATDGGA